MVGRILIKLLN